jgi:hypothetical protein
MSALIEIEMSAFGLPSFPVTSPSEDMELSIRERHRLSVLRHGSEGYSRQHKVDLSLS